MRYFLAFFLLFGLFFPQAEALQLLNTGTGVLITQPSSTASLSMTPTALTEGTVVEITGGTFGEAPTAQTLLCFSQQHCLGGDSLDQILLTWTPQRITFQLPPIANLPSSGTVTVRTSHPTDGSTLLMTTTVPYSYTSRRPIGTISYPTTPVVPETTLITITGSHLGTYDPASHYICINGTCLSSTMKSMYIEEWTPNKVQFRLPPQAQSSTTELALYIPLYTNERTGTVVHDVLRFSSIPVARTPDPQILSTAITTPIVPGESLIHIRGTHFSPYYIPGVHFICFSDSCLPKEDTSTLINKWSTDHIVLRLPDSYPLPTNPTVHLRMYRPSLGDYDMLYAPSPLALPDLPTLRTLPIALEFGKSHTITGIHFGNQRGSVTVGSRPMNITSWSSTHVTFTVPLTVESGALRVVARDGTTSLPHSIATSAIDRPTQDPYSHYSWHIPMLKVPQAWTISTGSPDIVVAVIDSAVDLTHEDLRHAIWRNPQEQLSGTDSDQNGFVDDIHGWDFISNTGKLTPINSHGTQVASIIAAAKDNNTGIVGVAPNVRIMSLNIAYQESDGSVSVDVEAVQNAIIYAVDNGASIINLSFGGLASASLYEEVLRYAYDHNVVVIAAAGNAGINLNNNFFTPACEQDDVSLAFGVAASTKDNTPAIFSNYGSTCIDLSAPGESMIGAVPMHTPGASIPYGITNGTSFATPIVAGAAALLRSTYSDWNVEEIYAVLRSNTTSFASGTFPDYGTGILSFATLLTTPRPQVSYIPRIHVEAPTITATDEKITLPDEDTLIPPSVDSTPTDQPTMPFPDVLPTDELSTPLQYLHSRGVVTGYPDGTFRPAVTMNRAEFLKVLFESTGSNVHESFGFCFPDVSDQWFARYVCLAKELGMVEGYADGTFRPEQTVNMAEALKMLLEVHRVPLTSTATDTWYTPYLETAQQHQLLSATTSTMDTPVPRGTMAHLLYALMRFVETVHMNP